MVIKMLKVPIINRKILRGIPKVLNLKTVYCICTQINFYNETRRTIGTYRTQINFYNKTRRTIGTFLYRFIALKGML